MHAVELLDDTAEAQDSRCWPLCPAARTAIMGARQPDEAAKFSKPARQTAAADEQAPPFTDSLPADAGRLPLSWAAPEDGSSESSWDSVYPRIAETPQPPGGALSDYEGFGNQGASGALGYGSSGEVGDRFGDSGLNSGGTTFDTCRQTGGCDDPLGPWDEGGEARFVTHCFFAVVLQVRRSPPTLVHTSPSSPLAETCE